MNSQLNIAVCVKLPGAQLNDSALVIILFFLNKTSNSCRSKYWTVFFFSKQRLFRSGLFGVCSSRWVPQRGWLCSGLWAKKSEGFFFFFNLKKPNVEGVRKFDRVSPLWSPTLSRLRDELPPRCKWNRSLLTVNPAVMNFSPSLCGENSLAESICESRHQTSVRPVPSFAITDMDGSAKLCTSNLDCSSNPLTFWQSQREPYWLTRSLMVS